MTWTIGIFQTNTGEPQEFTNTITTATQSVIEVSAASWETRLTGQGRGRHTIPLFNQGISRTTIRELAKGNKYTIVQMWGDHVAYAGVIQRTRYDRSTRSLTVDSMELRGAYFNARMSTGVEAYDPGETVLTVTSKSHSGAARIVVDAAMPNPEWELPIDLPADGSGAFSASWQFEERLKIEDHLAQIEADGCEIDFLPYLDGSGLLRWETRVATKITEGTATAVEAVGSDSPVLDLEVSADHAREMTGVLAFGKGGISANVVTVGGLDISVRDVWLNWPDISDLTRLQAAADAAFLELSEPTSQWSFGLHVFPDGPAFTAPGRLLTLSISGDEFIPDGDHAMRVVALRGDLSNKVIPEVRDAA